MMCIRDRNRNHSENDSNPNNGGNSCNHGPWVNQVQMNTEDKWMEMTEKTKGE